MAFPTVNYDLSNRTDVPSSLGGKAIQMVRFSKSITTAMLAVGIVTKLGELPAGSRIVGGYLEVPDLDSDGSPALTIGIGYRDANASVDDVDCILDAVTTGQAGGLCTLDEHAGLSFEAEANGWIALTIGVGGTSYTTIVIKGQIVLGYDG